MPNIYGKNKKVIEAPKQMQVPRQELPPVIEPTMMQVPQETEGFSSVAPKGQKTKAYRTDIPGQVATENIARSAEELGKLSVEERVSPEILNANQGMITKGAMFETSLTEDLKGMVATARGILRGIGIKIRAPGGINVREDTTIAETDGLVSKAMAMFKANPTDENAINAMNIIQISEDALIQQRAGTKVTATAEQLISGDISTYEYELEQNIKNTNAMRQIIADTLRKGYLAEAQAFADTPEKRIARSGTTPRMGGTK